MSEARTWTVGTRYHAQDTYRTMIDRGSVIPRLHPGTHNGLEDGLPVFRDAAWLRAKRRDMGPYTFAAQILQNPTADKSQGFREAWLRYWTPQNWRGMNRYVTVDPASKKKKDSDYTVMVVHGLGSDQNFYVIDWFRDRLNLTQRAKLLFRIHRHYRPLRVGYEQYGQQADIEHIESEMDALNYRFTITPLGGGMAKEDRIKRMVPYYEQRRWFIPDHCYHQNYEGDMVDVSSAYVNEEYLDFPIARHDDMLDGQSRILDPEMALLWPEPAEDSTEAAWTREMVEGRGFMAA